MIDDKGIDNKHIIGKNMTTNSNKTIQIRKQKEMNYNTAENVSFANISKAFT